MTLELLFTAEEANALLPRLRPLVAAMITAADALLEARTQGDDAAQTAAAQALAAAVRPVDALGVVVKDPHTGLCDFASDHDGRPVYLCWRLGEESVAHWHPRETGFAGRQPL